jgi:hypothetical protein
MGVLLTGRLEKSTRLLSIYVEPLGKRHSLVPLAHTGFPNHSHKVADIMSQRKRPDKPNKPQRKGTPSRQQTHVMTTLNPNAAGIDVHSIVVSTCDGPISEAGLSAFK